MELCSCPSLLLPGVWSVLGGISELLVLRYRAYVWTYKHSPDDNHFGKRRKLQWPFGRMHREYSVYTAVHKAPRRRAKGSLRRNCHSRRREHLDAVVDILWLSAQRSFPIFLPAPSIWFVGAAPAQCMLAVPVGGNSFHASCWYSSQCQTLVKLSLKLMQNFL